MPNHLLFTSALVGATLLASLPGQNVTYRDRAVYRAAAGTQPTQLETFDAFANRAIVTQLFGGRLPFREPFPLVFWGNWGGNTQFSGGALIAGNLSRQFVRNTPIVMDFPDPVFGIGSQVFNDFGSAFVITLTVETAQGNTFSIDDKNRPRQQLHAINHHAVSLSKITIFVVR